MPNKMKASAVIMAGGQGERFWPLTHGEYPKYRIRVDGKESLLLKTYNRLARIFDPSRIYVVTTEPHFNIIREELPKLPKDRIFIEPFRNNTAAAIYLSCRLIAEKRGGEEVVSFFPADHLIQNVSEFAKTLTGAVNIARGDETLVTIGIEPSFPATGYGYIECGKALPNEARAFSVDRFVEKPDKKKAAHYLKQRRFLWNAGIFTWRISVFLDMMRTASPEFEKNFNIKNLKASYRKLPNTSIDYALLEKAPRITVFKTRMDWCDVGNWDMYFEKSPCDKDKNFSSGNVLSKNAAGSLILNHTEKPLVALGVSGLIIVQTERGVLVCPKGRAEEAALHLKKSRKPS